MFPTPRRKANTGRAVDRHLRELSFAFALLCSSTQGLAQVEWGRLMDMRRLSAAEWDQLPEYCRYTEMWRTHEDLPTYREWRSRLGPAFDGMHHYCFGIVKGYRASSPALAGQSQHRTALLGSAIDEIEFVLRSAPEDFVLRPEVLLRGGQFAARLEAYPRALEYFEASIKAKTDYWPPYLEIANVNLKIGRRQHAVEVLERGLIMMPAQPQLKAALSRIEAYPELGKSGPRTPHR